MNDEKPGGRIRASDAEREEYAQIVRAAMGEGRLTMEDGEERLGRAYAAAYRDELDPLIADLPGNAPYTTPEFLDGARRRLRAHTGAAVSLAAVLVGLWLLMTLLVHPMFFWPAIPIAFLALGVLKRRQLYRWHRRGWGPRSGWAGGPPWAGGRGDGGPGGRARRRCHGAPPWAHR